MGRRVLAREAVMPRYAEPQANEWIQPVRKGYKMACCDCGLTHSLDFRIHKGRVQFRARSNRRSTAAIRRWMKSAESIERGAKKYAKALARLAGTDPCPRCGEQLVFDADGWATHACYGRPTKYRLLQRATKGGVE